MKKSLVAFAIFLAMMLSFTPTVPALAAPPVSTSVSQVTPQLALPMVRGCRGKVQNRLDNWSQDRHWSHPSGRLPEVEKLRLTVTPEYQFCPNKKRPMKIRVRKATYCYSHLSGMSAGDHWWFKGAVLDSHYFDDGNDMRPWARSIPDDGTVQNCNTFSFNPTPWLKPEWSAHWRAKSKIKISGPDSDWKSFRTDGRSYKFFKPLFDPAVSGWYR